MKNNNTTSPTKGIGMGYNKEFVGKRKENRQFFRTKSRFQCPNGCKNWTDNQISGRHDWLECRICGYANDVMYWYKSKQ